MGKQHIPEPLRRKDKKKSAGAAAAAPAVCLVLLVLLVLLIGAVIGRYQRQIDSDVSVRAKEFYFTSDFLDGQTHTLAPVSSVVSEGAGTTEGTGVPAGAEVTFTLGNHADELRYSEVDITYKVTVEQVTSGSGGGTTGTSDSGVTVKKDGEELTGSETLSGGEVADAEITISGLKPGTYVVTAVGTGGYSKTLTAMIVVPSEKGELYFYTELVAGEYTLLTVWNEGDVAGEVTITYTGIPDNTNPNMMDWVTGGDTSSPKNVVIAPHESKVFRFFNESDITVTGAAPKVPN